jgi:hypothetical protein
MRPIPVPFTDASLRLSLPFTGMPTGLRVLLTLGVVLVFLVLLFLLYRREMRLVPRRFAIALLGLRVAVIAAVFLTVALDPILARSVKEEVPGRVLIAVDRSDSMRVADPNRPLAEKLKIGKLLKLTTDLASEGQHDGWIRQAEAGGEVRFSVLGGSDERDRYLKVVKRLDETSRVTIAARILTPEGLRLVDALRAKHAVEVTAFGQDIVGVPTDPERLTAALNPTAKPGAASYTDLKLPLARAAESVGDAPDSTGAKLLGVVLLTDGRHNWGESPVTRAAELGLRKAPVYSVVIAPKDPPADVAVVSAQAQASTVFKGSVVPIEAQVRVTGWPAGKINVTLTYPDNPDGTKRDPQVEVVDHNGQDATYPITFKAKMDIPGPQPLTVTAEAGENDRFPENNKRIARVNVVKDRAKVMLIDGEARWEFHYLHTCLGRDPNMDVRSIVFRQPRIGAIKSEDELRKLGTPARKMPDDPDVLTSYDCIILGDVEPTQFTAQDRERIEKYVAEAGGTLVLTAGKRAMPVHYAQEDNDPIRKLLPIKNPRAYDSGERLPEGFPLVITDEGEKSWFLSMGDTGGENRQRWDRLPPHHWAVAGEAKDAADVLAALPGGSPRERAVIARQSYGFGRVLYVGIDSTWRWRFRAGDYFHHRFWGQVAQWAASDRLLPVTNASGTIRFGTREPVYTGSQDVEIVVRTAESVKKLGANALKAARVVRLPAEAGGKETPVGLVPLTNPEGRPRDLSGKVRDLTPGKYAVELDIPEWADELVGPPGPDGRATKLRCNFEVLPPDNEELVDLAANLPLLEELASASGGKVYSIENVHELLEVLAAQTAVREYFVERPLRQSWWVFGVFIALLSLEWALRKWAGLP